VTDDCSFVQLSRSGGPVFGVGIGGVAIDGLAATWCGWYTVEGARSPCSCSPGLRSGKFATGRIEVEGGDWWSYAPMAASGTRAVLSAGYKGKLTVIDATDVKDPSVSGELELGGTPRT